MLASKCPGQDRRNWKPEDIFEHECPHCGAVVEFWKTDIKARCPACRETILNPRFNLGCALWCAYADQCVGDISGVFTQRPEVLRDRLEIEVRKHFIGASSRFKYTLEAAEIASRLLEMEKEADPPVIVAATLLHDVGYTACRVALGEGEESPALENCFPAKSRELAAGILEELKLPRPVREKVLELLSPAEKEDKEKNRDLNRQLLEDILALARFKVRFLNNNPSDLEKKELLQLLHRGSSKKYAANHLGLTADY